MPLDSNTSMTRQRISLAVLLLGLALIVVHHQFFFYGYFGYDDLHYAKLSSQLLKGQLDYSDHYSYRWPVLIGTALSYSILGITDLASALPAMLLSAGILILTFQSLKDRPFSLLCAVILMFSVKWNVFYTDKLMPDVYVSFFLFAAWLIYFKLKDEAGFVKSVVFALCLFFAFLSKGTVILFTPLLIYYFVRDIRSNSLSKWMYPILIGSILLLLYFTFLYVFTGHPLSRFQAIEANRYYNSCSYDEMPIAAVWQRVTIDFIWFSYKSGLLFIFVFSALIRAYAAWKLRGKGLLREIHFYFMTILVLCLSIQFMTISINSYNPGCLDMRHYLFAVPIMAVSAVQMLARIELSGFKKGVVILVLLLSTVPSVKHAIYSKSLNYREVKEDIQLILQQPEFQTSVFISNKVMVNLLDYYSGFEHSGRFIDYQEIDPSLCIDQCYVIINWYSSFHSNSDIDQIKAELNTRGLKLEVETDFISGLKTISTYKVYHTRPKR